MLPRIVAVGTAVPQWRYGQEQLLEMAGRNRTREIFFLHSGIDYRHLYFEPDFTGQETIDRAVAALTEMASTFSISLGA